MQARPDLPIGIITLIGGEFNIHNLGFEPSMIWTPTTATPLVHWLSTMHYAIDIAEKAFLQANQEHKQDGMNAIRN